MTKNKRKVVAPKIKLSEVAEEGASYSVMSPQQLEKAIQKLESKMYQHAKDLEFEQAAQVRDEIDNLRKQFIVNS